MSDFDNTNRGSIWKNDKKEKDTHPDFTGSLNVNGVEYWVSAWKRKPDQSDKAPALSFSIKPKESSQPHQAPQRNAQGAQRSTAGDFEDIPFLPHSRGIAGYSM